MRTTEKENGTESKAQNQALELLASGWVRRTITDDQRLTELVELYESLEFEVHIEPLTPENLKAIGEECDSCYIDNWDKYKIIFTRQK
jgi:hypothetical protein